MRYLLSLHEDGALRHEGESRVIWDDEEHILEDEIVRRTESRVVARPDFDHLQWRDSKRTNVSMRRNKVIAPGER